MTTDLLAVRRTFAAAIVPRATPEPVTYPAPAPTMEETVRGLDWDGIAVATLRDALLTMAREIDTLTKHVRTLRIPA